MNNQRVIDGLQSTDYSFIVGDDQWVINEESKPNNFVASQLLIDVNDHLENSPKKAHALIG